jgi:diguanylate cyclase (GGDEF)-like protein
MKTSLRTYDVLGRFGGEEFLTVLPDTDLEEAFVLAERIRRNVREHCAADPALAQCGAVTISLGITSLRDSDKTVDDILKRADDSLYKAKASGKDKTASS